MAMKESFCPACFCKAFRHPACFSPLPIIYIFALIPRSLRILPIARSVRPGSPSPVR